MIFDTAAIGIPDSIDGFSASVYAFITLSYSPKTCVLTPLVITSMLSALLSLRRKAFTASLYPSVNGYIVISKVTFMNYCFETLAISASKEPFCSMALPTTTIVAPASKRSRAISGVFNPPPTMIGTSTWSATRFTILGETEF